MVDLTRPGGHPADTSVTSDQAHISISSQGTPEGSGGHSQLATRAQGDLSHTRPSRATHSLTEGDLLVGNKVTAVATLVERKTRYLVLASLDNGRTADKLNQAVTEQLRSFPEPLRRTPTWDQGKEIAGHQALRDATGIDVFLCEPNSPWQRGSNGSTNGFSASTSRDQPTSTPSTRPTLTGLLTL